MPYLKKIGYFIRRFGYGNIRIDEGDTRLSKNRNVSDVVGDD
jgi:hypothetical protein